MDGTLSPPAPTSRSHRRRFAAAGVSLTAIALLFALRLHLPLLEPEEALYAELPRQMADSGEWVVPHLHGEPYLDKPPLLYWLVAGCYRLFGQSVWSARLIPAAIALLTVVVVYRWAKTVGGSTAGWAAAAVLSLTGDFVYRGPMLTPNGLLALCTTGAAAAAVRAVGGDRFSAWAWTGSAVALGLGVLAKGPVAMALVLPPLLVFASTRPRGARPGLGGWVCYAAVAVGVAAPWFVAVTARQPDFPEYFFWKHHVERYTDPFDHAKPVSFYLPQLLLGGLPWAPAAGVAAARAVRGRTDAAPRPHLLFAVGLAVWAAVFFSASGSKRAVYLVPLWPPLAVAAGLALAPLVTGGSVRCVRLGARTWAVVTAVTAVVLGVGVAGWLPGYHRRFSLAPVSERLAELPPGTPVVCHPHPWNALDFARGGEWPLVRDADGLFGRGSDSAETVVVTKAGPSADALSTHFPPGWVVQTLLEHPPVIVLVVRRPPPTVP